MLNLEELKTMASICKDCSLWEGRKNPVFAKGSPNAKLMICGMVPAHEENESGVPFVGRAGKLLDVILEKTGLVYDEVYITNLVKCFLAPGKPLEKAWIDACSPYLVLQILNINPKVIITLGADSTRVLTGADPKMALGKMRNVEWYAHGAKIIPTYHPSYLLRKGGETSPDFSNVLSDFSLAKAELTNLV